jgi:hypothetical protein
MNADLSEYTRGLTERANPAVWRAYRRMREEGLSDHLIVVVLAGGEVETSIHPREEFWTELQAVVPASIELAQTAPARPPGTCWVVFIDREAAECGTRLQVAGFDGAVGLQNAFRSGSLLSRRKGNSCS